MSEHDKNKKKEVVAPKKEGTTPAKKEEYTPPSDMSAEKQRRLLQCWLMENMTSLSAKASTGYKNFNVVLGESREVRNNLISIPNCEKLFELTNQQIASIVPTFTLSREASGSSSNFHFDSFIQGLDSMLMTRNGRGSNVGFKSFSYEMKGGSPATAESLIEAKLVLHFASLSDLYRHRDGNPSFADLLGQPTRLVQGATCVVGKSDKQKAQNSDYYKISATLGYNSPSTIDAKAREHISHSSRTFDMTLVQHSVAFKEDGSLELELEYQSYIDKLLIDADVLSLSISPEERKVMNANIRSNCQRKEKLKKVQAQSSPGNNCGPNGTPGAGEDSGREDSGEEKKIKEQIEESAEKISEDKANAYSRLFDILIAHNKIYTVVVKAEDLVSGKASPSPKPETKPLDKDAKKAAKNKAKAAEEAGKAAAKKASETIKKAADFKGKGGIVTDSKQENRKQMLEGGEGGDLAISQDFFDFGAMNRDQEIPLNYFYFGDLLDAAFQCLGGADSKYKNLQILVGTFPHRNGSNIPLASIPISLKLFQAWWIKHVIMKEKTNYPLKAFIADTFSNLVRPALSPKNCYGTKHLIPRLGIETISKPSASGGRCKVTGSSVKSRGGEAVSVKKPVKASVTSGKKSKLPTAMYYYIYATTISNVNRKGDLSIQQKAQDFSKGIYWLKAGTANGLVKKIKFKKTDQAGVKEARIESEGASSGTLFIDRYNADVEMFGTSLFKPGMTVFIDPITSSIEAERSNAMAVGLGGYYKVIQVATSLEPGSYKTDLTCVWESPSSSSSSSGGCK